ncbi:hypothetical protein CP533_0499 [Ophiocordyceps camponoti-saundersi (nom. inval.)]|nr:hypothetical protein CP533_0499 [Ophiocordyceps camponoti-saundersi (nom. inval.)]
MSLDPRATKGDAYLGIQYGTKFTEIHNTIDKEQHRRKRRIISPVISQSSMLRFEPTMASQVDILLQKLLTSCETGKYVNMTEQCSYLAMDIICLLAFGFPLRTQTEAGYRAIPGGIDAVNWANNACMQWPLLKPLGRIMASAGFGNYHWFKKAVNTMYQERQMNQDDSLHDFYSVVSRHMDEKSRSFLQEELWPEAVLFLIAGRCGSTVSSALAAAFFYLSRNRSCYDALAKEIRSKFTSGSEIVSGPGLASCKYLRACIDETLRMSPAVTTLLWRAEEPDKKGRDQPFFIDGHVIPRGTQVAVNLYSLFHNEEYFQDSFSYKPERWLEPEEGQPESEEQKMARQTMRKAFAPFMLGDRSCAGRAMAYMEMTLTLARTMFYFDFEAAPGKAGLVGGGEAGRTDGRGRLDEFQLRDCFAAVTDGPNLIFHKRGDFWKSLSTE